MCIFNSYGFNLLGIQRENYVKVVISWVSLLNPREQKKKNLLEISFEKNLVNKNTDSIKEKPNS